MKYIKIAKRSNLPPDANTISHVAYKFKLNDDLSLKLKARIAPHGNEDNDKDVMKTDCCMCFPLGIRVVLSISSYKNGD